MTIPQLTDEQFTAEVERRHAAMYPGGCPMLCEACGARLGISHETEQERARRVRDNIARTFGHKTSGVRRG